MNGFAFTFFDTAIGRCALVWRGEAITGASLPEDSDKKLRVRLSRRFSNASEAKPPAFVSSVAEKIRALTDGEHVDLSTTPLDRNGLEDFANRVYDITLGIQPGDTLTYGDVAEKLGDKNLSRAVGAALGANPIPIIIPCHRAIARSGGIGGFSAPGGSDTKRKLLEIEGAFSAEKLPLFGGV